MAKFKLEYAHNGDLYQIAIYADSFDDAAARIESIKATAELNDGVVIHEEEASDAAVAWAQVRVEALKEQLQ
ncbi:hypothetical protein [Ectopseudomonas composti]|uniref:hypothetical protein n=1 Tax=Ectopseudomonas composti TaxID=658457 RepID=UPI000773B59A|nr:hypothetical protein [Pseudomonas composti]